MGDDGMKRGSDRQGMPRGRPAAGPFSLCPAGRDFPGRGVNPSQIVFDGIAAGMVVVVEALSK
jgi:hypothetical protein